MATYKINGPNGEEYEIDAPDNATPEQITFFLKSQQSAPKPQETIDKSYSHPASRFLYGGLKDALGLGQFAVNTAAELVPENSPIKRWSDESNQKIGNLDRKMQEAAKRDLGDDWNIADMAGQIVSPTNALFMGKKAAATTAGKVLQGFGLGAMGGAMQPVSDADNYWKTKAGQGLLGGLVGGAVAGATGKLTDKLSRKMLPTPQAQLDELATQNTDDAVRVALRDIGVNAESIPAPYLQEIKKQVFEGLQSGKKLDAAAIMRGLDFDKLGIKPLQGQLTRDPVLFSREKNLRGAIPEIATHLSGQEQQIRNTMSDLAGTPVDKFQFGDNALAALKSYDDAIRTKVGQMYDTARVSEGKDFVVPMENLNKEIEKIRNDYRHYIPKSVLKEFDNYRGGVISGAERIQKPFTLEEADQFTKLLNKYGYGPEPATNAAIGEIKGAVKKAVEDSVPGGGPFAPAVKAAAERFKLHEQVPALEAAARGTVAPDDFAGKFILNGKTKEVKQLADILRTQDPQAFEQARYQIGSQLQRALNGENVVGDAGSSGNSLAKLLRTYGDEKLSAFYNPQEIEQLHRLSRVAGYINTAPASNIVNNSNTLVGSLAEGPIIRGLLSNMGGGMVGNVASGAAKAGAGAVKNSMAAAQSMNPKIPVTNLPLTPRQYRLNDLLSTLLPLTSGGLISQYAFPQAPVE